MTRNRTDHLTALIPAIEIRCGTIVEYRPGRGWWLDNPDYPRHVGDTGDWLGKDWKAAESRLRWLYGEGTQT